MTWEKSASDKLDEMVCVVRDPFRGIIKSQAQAHAEIFAQVRKTPHVTILEAVLGFIRARSHKLSNEGRLLLQEYGLSEKDFDQFPQ